MRRGCAEGNLIMKRPLSENGDLKGTLQLDGRLHQPKRLHRLHALLSGQQGSFRDYPILQKTPQINQQPSGQGDDTDTPHTGPTTGKPF
jgi:hypothetical protein